MLPALKPHLPKELMGSGSSWALLSCELVVQVNSENAQSLQLFGNCGILVFLVKDLSKMVAWALLCLLRIPSSHLNVTAL